MKLRGRGAEVQGLTQALLKIWEEERNPAAEVHRMILQTLQENYKLEALLQEHKGEMALPKDFAKKHVDSAFKMAHLNQLFFDHFN